MNKPSSRVEATLNSRNFFVTIISLVMFTIAQISGANVPEGASEQLLDAINTQDLAMIFTIIIPNFVNPVMKIIKNKLFSWSGLKAIIKNPNFITQAITVVLLGTAGFGIIYPEGSASSLVDAIFGGDTGLMISAFVINIVNPLYHFIFVKKKDETSKKEAAA